MTNTDFTVITNETIEGYTIGVRRNEYRTTRKTILFVHGIGMSSLYFIPLARHLSNHFNILAFDLPGYGETKKPDHTLTIDELAKIVAAYVQEHQFKNIILIGHSMGCQIISRAVTQYSCTAAKLIFFSPTVNKEERTLARQSIRLLQDSLLESARTNALLIYDYFRLGPLRYLKTSRSMLDHHIENDLKNLSIPVLISRGEYDPIVPSNWLQFLGELSTSISFQEIPNAPHAFHFNHSKATAKMCRDFI